MAMIRNSLLFVGTICKTLAVICLSVTLTAGCSRKSNEPPKTGPRRPSIVIGLVPEQDMFKQRERYEPLARYLSARTGADIKLIVLPRYGNILNSFISSGMDAAFFGSFTYILAHARLGVQPVARPVGVDGRSTYHGLIFVRKDSHIRSVWEMRGKRFAFVDRDTTAGYLLPLAFFEKYGVHYPTYLKESYFTGTHEDAIYDVLEGKADIGAAKDTVLERLAAADEKIANELVMITRSPDVPENSLAVRKDLDASMKNRLKTALLNMHEDPEGAGALKDLGAQKFIEATDSDFKPVYDYARTLGLDLLTWGDNSR